jgi:hypothetical protein
MLLYLRRWSPFVGVAAKVAATNFSTNPNQEELWLTNLGCGGLMFPDSPSMSGNFAGGRIRQMMREKGYDALVLPYNTGHWGQFQADVQYVAGMGGNDSEITVVFPLNGDVTAWVRSSGYIPKWLGAQTGSATSATRAVSGGPRSSNA